MTEPRVPLPEGSVLKLQSGETYRITGRPIGFGGGSVIYPAVKQNPAGSGAPDSLPYVLKECYPLCALHSYVRRPDGEIRPAQDTEEARKYLAAVQEMQLREAANSQTIYKSAGRMLPIRASARDVWLTTPGGEERLVHNTVTVMDSLADKGRSLADWVGIQRRFPPALAFRILQQLLFAVGEVHRAGYLHLDLQDGNIFLQGSLNDKSEMITLIDFGSARPLRQGRTAPVSDRVLFASEGFSAPELFEQNDGSLRLGAEADLYSVGCLAFLLLTGGRPTRQQLLGSAGGRVLKANHLSRMKCPPYMKERIQDFLCRALAGEREKRYRSAEEMLRDVTALAEALQPQRDVLSEVDYSAFISYKHAPVDSGAAAALQQALEHYRPPRGLGLPKRPFRRVFVDEGELSSCADFGQQIRQALKNSAWLIVLCSPGTAASPWVASEIQTFLEFHDRSRILAVLIEGEPETAFPKALLGEDGGNQVLAADARGGSLSAVRRRLRGDALLKLAAPMLRLNFDSLKQRRKVYTLQKAAAAAAAGMVLAVGFAGYAMNRAQVISRQKTQLAEEYETSLRNESRFLTQQAMRRLGENDLPGALELAMAALPGEEQSRPVLPEAEYALSQALRLDQSPLATQETATLIRSAPTENGSFFADETGEYLFTYGGSGESLEVWKSREMSLAGRYFEGSYINTGRELLVPGEKLLIVTDSDRVMALDYASGALHWEFQTGLATANEASDSRQRAATEKFVRAACLSPDGSRVLVCTCDELTVFSTENEEQNFFFSLLDSRSGELLRRLPPLCLTQGDWTITLAAISGDQRCLALAMHDRENNAENFFAFDESVLLLDCETGESRFLPGNTGTVDALSFTEDGLILLRHSGVEAETGLGSETFIYREPIRCLLESYAPDSGEQNWSLPVTSGVNCLDGEILPMAYDTGEDSGRGLLFRFGEQVILVEPESGAILRRYELSDTIVDIARRDNGFAALCEDGQKTYASFLTEVTHSYPLLNGGLFNAELRGDFLYSVESDNDGKGRVLQQYGIGLYDLSYRELFSRETEDYYECQVLRSAGGSVPVISSDTEIILPDPVSGEARSCPLPRTGLRITGLSEDGTALYLSDDRTLYEDSEVYALSVETGQIQPCGAVPSAPERWGEDDCVSSPDGRRRARWREDALELVNAHGKLGVRIALEEKPETVCFTADNKGLLVMEQRVLSLYAVSDGALVSSVPMRDYGLSGYDGRLELLEDGKVFYSETPSGSVLLDVSDGALTAESMIPRCFGYVAETDSFLIQETHMNPRRFVVGSFPRHSLEEMLCLGRERLAELNGTP